MGDIIRFVKEKVHWLGHDGFRIEGSKIVYIDPFDASDGPKADIILATHEHFDHCSPPDIERFLKPDTVIITEKDSAAKLKKELNGEQDIRVVKSGDILEVDGVKIEALPAYNVNKDFHPKRNGWLGFIVEMDGVRIYHAGDTDKIPEMKDINVDIAMLPVSGVYVMTWQEAVEAARLIRPKVAIPMHYGAIVGSEEDAINFSNALKGEVETLILKKH